MLIGAVNMQGRTVDFKNTLIIMTSNVGSSVIEKGGGGLGFQLDTSEEDSSYNRIKTLVNEELKQYFRPEFLNRFVPCWYLAVRHTASTCRHDTAHCSVHHSCGIRLRCHMQINKQLQSLQGIQMLVGSGAVCACLLSACAAP